MAVSIQRSSMKWYDSVKIKMIGFFLFVSVIFLISITVRYNNVTILADISLGSVNRLSGSGSHCSPFIYMPFKKTKFGT